jgi:flagellin-specific chaperone FliS
MSQRLLLASMRNDTTGFEEVKKLLNELRSAWTSIDQPPRPADQPKSGLAAVAAGRVR